MTDNKLGFIEYQEVLLDNVSKMVINRNYVFENKDFFDNVIFKMFEVYAETYNEPVSIRKQAQMLEIFLGMNIKYKPTQELPEDIL